VLHVEYDPFHKLPQRIAKQFYCFTIGVASYGALGHVSSPLDFQLFNFWGVTSEPHKL